MSGVSRKKSIGRHTAHCGLIHVSGKQEQVTVDRQKEVECLGLEKRNDKFLVLRKAGYIRTGIGKNKIHPATFYMFL
jgi:hypothetical protein